MLQNYCSTTPTGWAQGHRWVGRSGGRRSVRLTRRGRVVATGSAAVLATVAAVLLWIGSSGGARAAEHGPARAGYRGMTRVVVRPGQTLWSIASAAEPWADPRSVIQQIMQANALSGSAISPGETLWVPKG